MRCRVASAVICLLLSASPRATIVIAPSFEELVREADVVFEGEVIDTTSRITVEGGAETIVTDVSFRVGRMLKGTSGPVMVLEFLGGVVGDRGFRVDGVPTFARGDRDVIFADTSQRLVSPLVRVMHGRLRITKDGPAGQESVRQFDGRPLRDVAAFGSAEKQPALSPIPAMSLAAFESAVAAEVARQGDDKRPRR
jgi:hypothetical protein